MQSARRRVSRDDGPRLPWRPIKETVRPDSGDASRDASRRLASVMETSVSPAVRKWIKKCLKEEFEETVKDGLENEKSTYAVAEEIMQSSEMRVLMRSMKSALEDQDGFSGRSSALMSFGSDLSSEEWSPYKVPADQYACVIEKISYDKPVHVRLAGYERLLESELGNVGNSDSWDILLKTLRDGIADDSRPVFEASLRVHAKLVNGSRSHDVYTNLLSAFNAQFHSRKLNDTLPTLNTGINFKIFLHEKLVRLMRLIIHHQEEVLRSIRTIDRVAEEMIEQFVVFLSSHTFGSAVHSKTLNTLNILSVVEPQAGWSKKWMHGLATRKTVVAALSKSPSLLQSIVGAVSKGLEKPPDSLALTITDEPVEAFISGEAVEAATYLHGLHFLAQLSSYSAGRTLLSEGTFESSPPVSDFAVALLNSLNTLASSATTSGIYNSSRDALRYILERSTAFADSRFYGMAVAPLVRSNGADGKIWAHTLDILNQMLDTRDGVNFLNGGDRARSANAGEAPPRAPIVAAVEHIAGLLRQPFSVMNIEHVVQLFAFVGRLFGVHEVYEILEDTLRRQFFPAVGYLYSKMDKYAVGHESKTQYLDSAAKSMLLKIVSSPLGLCALVSEAPVFQELIRGSIAPLRAPWSSNEIVGFVSSAAYFDLGSKTLTEFAPQSLSTFLEEVCTVLEDPRNFHDPWDNANLDKFLHLLSCLSLSTRCFIAFMADPGYEDGCDENSYPRTLRDLIRHSANVDSPYHYLGLLSINAFVWNLDTHVCLMHYCNFQENMLKLQGLCAHEVEEDGQSRTVHVVDNCSMLRHQILTNSYHIAHKLNNPIDDPEDCVLFSEYPPPQDSRIPSAVSRSSSSTELGDFLRDSKPGLRDSGWVLEARRAHKNSPDPMKNSVVINLLDQMRKAIPTAEWVDNFKWESSSGKRDWSPEENLCFDLALRYANDNCSLANLQQAKEDMKTFVEAAHKFINYEQPAKFEGFDWFLATVFVICEGKVDSCKIFVEQIVRFPSAMFVWPIFGVAIDQNNGEEMATQFLFAQHLEDVVDNELSTVNYALKNHCGVHWWMICNRLLAQCFWGVLSWDEIVNFIAICILYSADYVVYYCVSLLHHSQARLMENIANKNLWPEHMNFKDYRSRNHMAFIDRIGKRHVNRVLPTLTQRKLIAAEEE